MDIFQHKKQEMQEIIDFYYHIEEYGHIYYDEPELLDKPFNKILEGINEITKLIENNYSR